MAGKLLWVAVLLVGMTLWVRADARRFWQFATLADSADRRRCYWRWIAESFVILVGAGVVTQWLAGAWGNPFILPEAYRQLHGALRPENLPATSDAALGMTTGFVAAIVAVVFIHYRRIRRAMAPLHGDFEALVPRNWRERLIAVPLSLNAGFSEEYLFRFALPLLLAQVTGSLPAGFVLATVAFGCAHLYQGWRGILGTMVAGAVLALIYLASGSLLRVMIVHAAIDVVALIVRPALSQWVVRRSGRLSRDVATG